MQNNFIFDLRKCINKQLIRSENSRNAKNEFSSALFFPLKYLKLNNAIDSVNGTSLWFSGKLSTINYKNEKKCF